MVSIELTMNSLSDWFSNTCALEYKHDLWIWLFFLSHILNISIWTESFYIGTDSND